jgi:hypothetical protein
MHTCGRTGVLAPLVLGVSLPAAISAMTCCFVADQLQATWTASAAPAAPKALAATADDGYDNSREAFLSVACGETNNPTLPALWPVIAAVADARTPYFGAALGLGRRAVRHLVGQGRRPLHRLVHRDDRAPAAVRQ